MPAATNTWLNKLAKEKTKLLQQMFEMEPIHVPVKHPITKQPKPHCQGEDIVYKWDEIYDDKIKGIVVETETGPSTPGKDYVDDINANPAMPYQQLRALLGDGGRWKWPEIWKNLDVLPRRGPAWRHIDDPSNLGKIENPNPQIVPLKCLVVGGGPVGLRLAIELVLGGHRVTIYERRREIIDAESGKYEKVGFTNRVNRPHINNFCRNDLDRLNGRNFMTPKMCYPVFTNTSTSSIGIDECQMLLLKTALLLGVNFELGVGYKNAEIDIENEKNQRPTWLVDYTADSMAQERYGKSETGEERFDALFGCDGGQSKVRVTQEDWLGTPKTRSYKKMFGIVSNLRKVGKKKLRELGHESGLEPEDRAGGMSGVFFYKASYHNYFIVHPSAEEMRANGIPWEGLFSFNSARKEIDKKKEAHKALLKKFMTQKAKELGIPIDERLPNGGFVEEPNDVMGFDFSEFYNCEKSAACMVPPLEWDTDIDDEWEIHCPLVALAGDAVADPNWLLGVGLQRGWNSAFDACFYADNIYNNKTFNGKPPCKDEPIEDPIEWFQHMDNMINLMQTLGNASRDSKLSCEMETGMLDEKGPVVIQIRNQSAMRKGDAPVPQYLPEVEPWGRYKQFTLDVNNNYKGRDLFDNVHPCATRELAIYNHNEHIVARNAILKMRANRPGAAFLTWPKRFDCSAFWGMMKLLEVDGKSAPGEKPLDKPTKEEEPVEIKPPKIDRDEVQLIALRKSKSLRESMLMKAMNPTPAGVHVKDRSAMDSFICHNSRESYRSLQKHLPPEPAPVPNVIVKGVPLEKRVSSEDLHFMECASSFTTLNSMDSSHFSNSSKKNLSPVREQPMPEIVTHDMKSTGAQLKESLLSLSIPSKGDFPSVASMFHKSKTSLSRQKVAFTSSTTDIAPPAPPALSSGSDPMHSVRLATVKYEKEAMKAKLYMAEKEIARAKAEEEAAKARIVYAQTEYKMLKNVLAAYEIAEAKLHDMA